MRKTRHVWTVFGQIWSSCSFCSSKDILRMAQKRKTSFYTFIWKSILHFYMYRSVSKAKNLCNQAVQGIIPIVHYLRYSLADSWRTINSLFFAFRSHIRTLGKVYGDWLDPKFDLICLIQDDDLDDVLSVSFQLPPGNVITINTSDQPYFIISCHRVSHSWYGKKMPTYVFPI
jgi:hypothetical protein